MRIIVDTFKEALELGLEKPNQIVVGIDLFLHTLAIQRIGCCHSWDVLVHRMFSIWDLEWLPDTIYNPRNTLWWLIIYLQPMVPTYVFGWPTGEERGDYLAIDLGTLNFCTWGRTLMAKIRRNQSPCMLGYSAGRGKVWSDPIKAPSFRGTEARWWSKAFRFLRGVSEELH